MDLRYCQHCTKPIPYNGRPAAYKKRVTCCKVCQDEYLTYANKVWEEASTSNDVIDLFLKRKL